MSFSDKEKIKNELLTLCTTHDLKTCNISIIGLLDVLQFKLKEMLDMHSNIDVLDYKYNVMRNIQSKIGMDIVSLDHVDTKIYKKARSLLCQMLLQIMHIEDTGNDEIRAKFTYLKNKICNILELEEFEFSNSEMDSIYAKCELNLKT